jgi:hypothetical protein
MSKPDFRLQLAGWYQKNLDWARRAGVALRFGQTEDDRPKQSAWVAAEKGGRIADLTVWSSGEAEFLAGRSGDIDDINEHHELETEEELEALLERFIAFGS